MLCMKYACMDSLQFSEMNESCLTTTIYVSVGDWACGFLFFESERNVPTNQQQRSGGRSVCTLPSLFAELF